MPKIVYANVVWFLVVMASLIDTSVMHHQSADWDDMPDSRLHYDLLLVGVFGCYCLAAIVGLLSRKKWGYSAAMGFNYVIGALSIAPTIAIIVVSLRSDLPISSMSDAGLAWGVTSTGVILGIISVVLIVLMKQKHVRSVFEGS